MGGEQTPGSLLSSGTGIDIPVLLLLIDGDEKMLKVQGPRCLGLRWEVAGGLGPEPEERSGLGIWIPGGVNACLP